MKESKRELKVKQAREMHNIPIPKELIAEKRRQMQAVEQKKILNVVYHQGDYFIHEPSGDKRVPRDPDLIIDKHIWEILRFKPAQRSLVEINDVIRFGRVTFKVTELVITP